MDKLKESTAAINDMTSLDDYEERPKQRKQSRFLRRQSYDQSLPDNNASYNVGRMADDILGENTYPPRDEPRASMSYSTRTSNPTRKHSYQSSLDMDRFSDRSSPESRTTSKSTTKRFGGGGDEDDDLDAMINSLKQKTSGKDMYKIVGEIEGEASGRTLGRRSVSPNPPRRQYHENPPPSEPRQHQRQMSQNRYDPYENMRGGTGYNFDFEQSRQQQPQHPQQPPFGGYHSQGQMGNASPYGGYYQQPQQPAMNPYSFAARSQAYGYQPQMQPGFQQQMAGRRLPQQNPYGYYYE